MSAKSTREKGAGGEFIARTYLKQLGYKILDLNFRLKIGEVDIIALDLETIVFVEVKSATKPGFGNPLGWVPFWKQQRIIRVSQIYLSRKNLYNSPARFDVIAIDPTMRVYHVKNAFSAPGDVFV